MHWSHGYFASETYLSDFYRELSPSWLDFAALVKGHRPPRAQEGTAFHYLELGSGMGLGLCLLAASFPEGQFVGIDYQPDHIAHSQWLAGQLGLSNITFLELDFLEIQQGLSSGRLPSGDQGPLQPGRFHYVVAHGILTWVAESIQEALLSVAASMLKQAGLFYCSYNTFPGWLGKTTFQMLTQLERRHAGSIDPLRPFQSAQEKLAVLLGSPAAPLPLGLVLPGLGTEISSICRESRPAYLKGEYFSTGWAPLYVAEMHERSLTHKLSHVATASLAELFPQLLGEPRRSLVLQEEHPILREALFDLAINQTFRRDIFTKGKLPLPESERLARLGNQLLIAIPSPAPQGEPRAKPVATSLGLLEVDPALVQALETVMATGPVAIESLGLALGWECDALLPSLALLLQDNRIGLHRGAAAATAGESSLRVNARLLDLMQQGHAYSFLAAPTIGSALHCSPLDALILGAISQGLEAPLIGQVVLMGLTALGGTLRDHQGKPIEDEQLAMNSLGNYIHTFQATRLPQMQQLGCLPSLA